MRSFHPSWCTQLLIVLMMGHWHAVIVVLLIIHVRLHIPAISMGRLDISGRVINDDDAGTFY